MLGHGRHAPITCSATRRCVMRRHLCQLSTAEPVRSKSVASLNTIPYLHGVQTSGTACKQNILEFSHSLNPDCGQKGVLNLCGTDYRIASATTSCWVCFVRLGSSAGFMCLPPCHSSKKKSAGREPPARPSWVEEHGSAGGVMGNLLGFRV